MARPTRLQKCLDRLAAHQGTWAGGAPRDAWAAVLWENVVGPTDEPRRDLALAALDRATGLAADRIATAPDATLLPICGNARHAPERLAALRACAGAFVTVGDPRHLVEAEHATAVALLGAFPGIDGIVAERILLFAGRSNRVALDAHGLRAVVRIGYGDEAGDEAQLRRTAECAVADELLDLAEVRIDAVTRLRQHAVTLCTRRPHCDACPIANLCEANRLDGKNR